MAENKKSPEFLKKLAVLTDEVEKTINGKTTLVIELQENEYRKIILEFEDIPDPNQNNLKLKFQEWTLFLFWMSRRFSV